MSIPAINEVCNHKNHIFSQPLCPKQSLLSRIANVAFHILTLGIPLAVYKIISCCFSARSSHTEDSADIQNLGKKSVQADKTVAPAVKKALDYARTQFDSNPEIDAHMFSAGWHGSSETHQPTNPDISKLSTLHYTSFNKLEEALKENQENPWNDEKVLEAADNFMKISYAISVLTLEDLKPFTEKLSSEGEDRTYAQALTQQDSYQYRTFYYCTNAYHWIRSAITWGTSPYSDEEGLFPTNPIPKSHAQPFYKKGTLQNSWNTMYNDYCGLIRKYVKEKDLKAADGRHVNWTQKDTKISSFHASPDTQPT